MRFEKFHNEKLQHFVIFATYYQSDQIKEGKIGRACRTHGEIINAYRSVT
jgi:hypothetical protein